jgi:hypothetical protein
LISQIDSQEPLSQELKAKHQTSGIVISELEQQLKQIASLEPVMMLPLYLTTL